ncbi:hypothetical protein C8F01DRAFT_1156571 [Mycena amicta]|nr:hypothetical protein C8F01DRAFT_1156571 [Mycena amicta]
MTTPATDNVDPRLPPELEQRIFETTALIHPDVIPKLALVAHRVWTWVEPFLYRTVNIPELNEKKGVGASILGHLTNGTKPPAFFHKAVRNFQLFPVHWLFMGARPSPNAWKMDELKRLLEACTGVDNFLLIANLHSSDLDLRPSLEHWRPRRVFFFCDGPVDFKEFQTLATFSCITHLLIVADARGSSDPIFDKPSNLRALAQLGGLQHLALATTPPVVLNLILSACPSLHTLILNLSADAMVPDGLDVTDVRLVVMGSENLMSDWDAATRGEMDFWERASDFVEKKRRGEIDASCFTLPAPPPRQDESSEADEGAAAALPSAAVVASKPKPEPLPSELIRRILRLAASNYPSTIATLLLVCRRVYDWIVPLLFKHIHITLNARRTARDHSLLRAVNRHLLGNGTVQSLHLATAVRDSITAPDDDIWTAEDKDILLLFIQCVASQHRLRDLSLNFDLSLVDQRKIVNVLPILRPSRVALPLSHPAPSLRFLRDATHLRLLSSSNDDSHNPFADESEDTDLLLQHLSAFVNANQGSLTTLTHLAIPCPAPNDPAACVRLLVGVSAIFPGLHAVVLTVGVFVDGRWLAGHLGQALADQAGGMLNPIIVMLPVEKQLERSFWDYILDRVLPEGEKDEESAGKFCFELFYVQG